MLLDLSNKAQVPNTWLLTIMKRLMAWTGATWAFEKVSTEQTLSLQQAWPNEASGAFKTNSMSSAYVTSIVESNGSQKRLWLWWRLGRRGCFASWLTWRWWALSDKRVSMNSAAGNDLLSFTPWRYLALIYAVSNGWADSLSTHWRWFMWVSCAWTLIIHMIINKK